MATATSILAGQPTLFAIGLSDRRLYIGDIPDFANSGLLYDFSAYLSYGYSVAYHQPSKKVFVAGDQVLSFHLPTSGIAVLASGSAVAIDDVNDRLYVVGTEGGSGFIRRCDLDGGDIETLACVESMLPRCVALDIPSGHIFVADEASQLLLRYNLDGTEQTTIASGLRYPRGLTLDLDDRYAFFAYASAGSAEVDVVERCDINSYPNSGRVLYNVIDNAGWRGLSYASGYIYGTSAFLGTTDPLHRWTVPGVYVALWNPGFTLWGVGTFEEKGYTRSTSIDAYMDGYAAMSGSLTLHIRGGKVTGFILHPHEVIFYHDCDSNTEFVRCEEWTGSGMVQRAGVVRYGFGR